MDSTTISSPQYPHVVTSQPMPIQHVAVGPGSTATVCPNCHSSIQTNVRHDATLQTHMAALLLCVFGCWPCVCCPYCMDSCQNTNHYCPNCDQIIGTYKA